MIRRELLNSHPDPLLKKLYVGSTVLLPHTTFHASPQKHISTKAVIDTATRSRALTQIMSWPHRNQMGHSRGMLREAQHT